MSFSNFPILFAACFLCATASAQFGPGTSVTTNAHDVIEIRALDMDGDQDLDIVVRQPSAIAWLENDSEGNFEAMDTIFIATDFVGEFDMADTDADGDMDLLVADPATSTILFVLNEGNGLFAAPLVVVNTEPNGVGSLVCSDLIGDNLPELIYRGIETVYWAVNEDGAFGTLDSLFVGGNQLSRGLFVWDMDDDGDNDFLTFSGLTPDGRVGINPGGSGGPWTGTILLPGFIHHHPYNLLDVDEDGDLDLVAADAWREYEFEGGSIGTFVSHSIDGLAMGPVHAAAVANFGCGDAVSAVRCSANFGNPNVPVEWTTFDAVLGEFGPINVLPDLPTSRAMCSGDLDGDEREDLTLWHHDSLLTWHRSSLTPEEVSVAYNILCGDGPVIQLGNEGLPSGGSYFLNDFNTPVTELDPAVLTDSSYALIYVYTEPITGCAYSASTIFTVEVCVGVEEYVEPALHVFPNPSKDGTVHITGYLPSTDLVLYDATGRVLWQRRAVGSNAPIEVTGLASGMYRLVAIGAVGVKAVGVIVD